MSVAVGGGDTAADRKQKRTNTNNKHGGRRKHSSRNKQDGDGGGGGGATGQYSHMGGGVEHYREYSPPMGVPDFMMNPFDRPTSEQLTELHIYTVPPEYWDDKHNCAFNTVMNFTTSVGFIRVDPETRLSALRDVLIHQITQSGGILPHQFVFLKSVGRALTLVKNQQETQLKVKNFLPPFAYAPELFVMTTDADRDRSRRREVPPLAQPPQHQYVPTHHTQQQQQSMPAPVSYRNTPPQQMGMGGYHPQSRQSHYRGGGGMYGGTGAGGPSMNGHQYGGGGTHNHNQPPGGYAAQGRRNQFTPSAYPHRSHPNMPPHHQQQQQQQQPQQLPHHSNRVVMQGQNIQDNRVFPPQSEFFPGFGGYLPTKRIGYPMDYGPPMSASPPETAMRPMEGQDYNYDGEATALLPINDEAVSSELNRTQSSASRSSSSESDKEVSLEARQRQLEKEERKLERQKEEQSRKMEDEMRQIEKDMEQKLRDLERERATVERDKEQEMFQRQQQLVDEADKREKAITEKRRNLERQMQENERKCEEEINIQMKSFQKTVSEERRKIEEKFREQDDENRKKLAQQEKEQADKVREIERAKMELEKKQLEQEKKVMQSQSQLQKEKMQLKREKQALVKEEKEAIESERADAISRNAMRGDDSDSRPGSSPPKMKFPRAKTPDLLEEFQKKLVELGKLKEERQEIEAVRDNQIHKIHVIHDKAAERRAQGRDNWKKQYFEEKKKTGPLEEHLEKLKREVDNLNRRVINRLEKEAVTQQDPQKQAETHSKVVFMKLQNEMEDIKQKSEEMQTKLLGEIKRRIQCERETRCLHRDHVQNRKIANLPLPSGAAAAAAAGVSVHWDENKSA